MVQFLINFNVSLPTDTKTVELINFSGQKQGFGPRDNADCKHREALSELHRSVPQGNPAAVTDLYDKPE